MGTIQSSVNQVLGTAGTAAAIAEHLGKERKEVAAANAADTEVIKRNEAALRNDQYEAQQAILAHAEDEGLTDEAIERLKNNPSYAQELRQSVLKANRQTRLEQASEAYNANPNKNNSKQLEYAYEALRELNSRIEATETLKFNIDSAKARIKARGGKF